MARQKTKAERLAEGVKKAVGAGKPRSLQIADFSDPNRPPTCLEIDFPILPVNRVAAIEGNAMKPVYTLGKWWAWRRSVIFRSLILSAAAKAPDDSLEAGKHIWDTYYNNHQRNEALRELVVVDPFMGGGTTVVEGSRLGVQVRGFDLNPVAWLVVKSRVSSVAQNEIDALLSDIESSAGAAVQPFYALSCPRGHQGSWIDLSTNRTMPSSFDPIDLNPYERRNYRYEGPQVIYAFWAKHGPCKVTGCGHRTPVISKPVFAVKELTVRYWPMKCRHTDCLRTFDLEEADARMAPAAPLVVAETERPFTTARNEHSLCPPRRRRFDVECPHCGQVHTEVDVAEKPPKKKKVHLSLLVHPQWIAGESSMAPGGALFGGTKDADARTTQDWQRARASKIELVEVRGQLPAEIRDPLSEGTIKTGTDGGTVSGSGKFTCAACGTEQRLVESIEATATTAPISEFAVQGYCPGCDSEGQLYNGRFFLAPKDARNANEAVAEWEQEKEGDLSAFWPRTEIPFGHMTHQRQPLPQHGYTHWADMFNPRQLLVLSRLLRAIVESGGEAHRWEAREAVLVTFQQFVRNENMMCFWHRSRDHFAPALSNANFHPKSSLIEVGPFSPVGYGPWPSTARGLADASEWKASPWELVSNDALREEHPSIAELTSGRSEKAYPADPPLGARLEVGSATNLASLETATVDLVITDPPFGDNLHYSELSDFFYAWLRLALKHKYPEVFASENVPKSLEIVENKARNPENPGAFYQRLLTAAWSEAGRILKPSGILAFTFHHSEDEPWVQVLESLFDAGFYLEATYPIRSDEIKGGGEFGSKKVEYDIIHVCRKRTVEPRRVSWAKMRRQILKEVSRLQGLLEHHQRDGLPSADLEVIKRGKALEYYSKHYGQVYEAEGQALSVKDAVLGVLQVLEEESNPGVEPPPVTASPFTRQLMRMLRGTSEQPLDQVQKYLRGTGISPSEFESRGWIHEDKKVYYVTPFLDVAQAWHRKHRVGMLHDYDQAAFLIGACFDGSGIKAEDTLSNTKFKPHPALGSLLEWFSTHSTDPAVRVAAGRADRLYRSWQARNRSTVQQLALFTDDGGDA